VPFKRSICIVALVPALAVAACGGDGDETTTEAPDSGVTEELTRQFDAAGHDLNSAIETYNTRSTQDVQRENLAALQADTRALRDAVFEFDQTVRDLPFPSSLEEEVNTVLDANGTVIADLDAVGEAGSGPEALDLLQRFRDDKAKQFDPAHQRLTDGLARGLSGNGSADAVDGGGIDAAQLEDFMEGGLSAQSVDCSDDLQSEKGQSFDCEVVGATDSSGGELGDGTATVTQQDEKGLAFNYEVELESSDGITTPQEGSVLLEGG
jgi:hypothetical protein